MSAIALALAGVNTFALPELAVEETVAALEGGVRQGPDPPLADLVRQLSAIEKTLICLQSRANQIADRDAGGTAGKLVDALIDVPSDTSVSAIWKNAAAWSAVQTILVRKTGIRSGKLDAFFEELDVGIDEAIEMAQKPALAFAKFDMLRADYVKKGLPLRDAPEGEEEDDDKRRRETYNRAIVDRFEQLNTARDALAATYSTLYDVVSKEGQKVADVLSDHNEAVQLYGSYKEKLTGDSWLADPVEVVLEDPIVADSVLRLDVTFRAADEDKPQFWQRSVAMRTKRHYPQYILNVGVGFNSFDFKSLALEQTTTADSTGSLRNTLTEQDDSSYERVTPVWLQSIKIGPADGGPAIYGTFGTTPDRNIFRNLVLGGSYYHPPWRTLFTVGVMGARGFTEEDLESLKMEFTDGNFALSGTDLELLPLPSEPWHWSFLFGLTFNVLSN